MKYRIRRAHLGDCPALTEIWEDAVKATHGFLSPEDFGFFRSKLPIYFDSLDLFVFEYTGGGIAGFAGIGGGTLEMLFVRDRGRGVGRVLLDFAVKERFVTKTSVNAQNAAAVAFYTGYGFRETERSPVDSEGKHYPVINMEIEPARPQMPHGHPPVAGHPGGGHSHGHPGGEGHLHGNPHGNGGGIK